jgi:hypothetical protein
VKRKARATTFCCTTIRATTICSRKARAITTAGLGHVDQERLDARLTTAHSSPRVVQSFSTTKICSTTKRCGIGRCGLDVPQGQSPIVHSCWWTLISKLIFLPKLPRKMKQVRLVGEPRRPLFGWQLHLLGQRAIDKLVGGLHSGLEGIKRVIKETYICN